MIGSFYNFESDGAVLFCKFIKYGGRDDIVKVSVLEVDEKRKRISLTMKGVKE